jgi:hypothetical protein
VPQSEWFSLAHVRHIDHLRDVADLFEQVQLAALLQKALELDVHVEVIFDGVLAAAGDDDDVLDA